MSQTLSEEVQIGVRTADAKELMKPMKKRTVNTEKIIVKPDSHRYCMKGTSMLGDQCMGSIDLLMLIFEN